MEISAENFFGLLKKLIAEKHYEGVKLLFGSDQLANWESVKGSASDLIEILLVNMNDDTYKNDLELYTCCEEVMKSMSTHAGAEEMLFEMLQIVEENPSENVFTSALKCLQICLLRLKGEKSRAMEWTLNSIVTRISELKRPDYLLGVCTQKMENLFEQNDDILKILSHYITLAFFYEPLLEDVLKESADGDCSCMNFNRRNVLCCFFLQLLGKPLCYLDLTSNEKKTNTYTMQSATSLVKSATKILQNPFELFAIVEEKCLKKVSSNESVDEATDLLAEKNIFLFEEKAPLLAMAIFYYLVIVEGICLEAVPQIYHPNYIFRTCLFLVVELFKSEIPVLQWRGFLLCHKTLDNRELFQLDDQCWTEEVHKQFLALLCRIIGYSGAKRLRQSGVTLIKKYILSFCDESRVAIIKYLIKEQTHNGLRGYLLTIHKDLVAEKLQTKEPLPSCYSGTEFSEFLMGCNCVLKNGVETDLIENSDSIIPALNAIRFYALTDESNVTGFWNLSKTIEKDFLDPLRMAINMSVAHYKAEIQAVQTSKAHNAKYDRLANMMNIDTANGSNASIALDPEQKVKVLNQSLTTFDLLRCLLARATECVEKRNRKLRNA